MKAARTDAGYGRARRHRPFAMGLALVVLAGCQSDGETAAEPEAWETKSRSVLARDPLPRITLPEPYDLHGGPEARAASVGLLIEAAGSSSALVRANSIEALMSEPEHLEPVLRLRLVDENRGVRFVAAMSAGKTRMKTLIPQLEDLLVDPSPSVRGAAIFALRRCGRPADPTRLGVMLQSNDPEVRGNAALILGELGDVSALPMLRETVRLRMPRTSQARRRIVDLQIAEAMVKLGAENQLEVIRAALFAPDEQGEISVLAAHMCGRLRDRSYGGALFDIAARTGPGERPAEIRLAAIQALAQLEPGRAPVQPAIEWLASDRAELRAQAAVTLGWIRDPSVLPALCVLLDDPNPLVQVAAAGAVLRIPPA